MTPFRNAIFNTGDCPGPDLGGGRHYRAALSVTRRNRETFAIQDRIQHRLVAALAAGDARRNPPRLVSKGGTLLRVCALPDYRFSEDLDFDWMWSPTASGPQLRRPSRRRQAGERSSTSHPAR